MKSQRPPLSVLQRLRLALLVALAALLASVAVSACGAARPADAGDVGDVATTAPGPATSAPYVAADAQFMRDMLVHHAQALEMTNLVPGRSDSEDVHLLAQRIDQTQMYEIGLMRDWLTHRDEPAPDMEEMLGAHGGHAAGHDGGHDGMAGMATPEQMRALEAASGEAFDRLFLELMIRHHEGALVMVDELMEHDGAGQEPEMFVLLSHIDADQRAEIARMRRMLNSLGGQG